MDLGLANGIYSNKLEGNAIGIYDNINTGLHNGLYNENIIENGIVKNGLIFYVDAANPYSSPYAGTTWNDLSGKNYNGTLTNGPIFKTLNKGCVSFDGVNDYCDFGTTSDMTGLTNISVCAWCYPPNRNGTIIINRYSQALLNGWFLLYNTIGKFSFDGRESSTTYLALTTNNVYAINQWYYIVATKFGNLWRIYVNGQLDIQNTIGLGNVAFLSYNLYAGKVDSTTSIYYNYTLSQSQIYNRAITPAEVAQNFNATKSRYGY